MRGKRIDRRHRGGTRGHGKRTECGGDSGAEFFARGVADRREGATRGVLRIEARRVSDTEPVLVVQEFHLRDALRGKFVEEPAQLFHPPDPRLHLLLTLGPGRRVRRSERRQRGELPLRRREVARQDIVLLTQRSAVLGQAGGGLSQGGKFERLGVAKSDGVAPLHVSETFPSPRRLEIQAKFPANK